MISKRLCKSISIQKKGRATGRTRSGRHSVQGELKSSQEAEGGSSVRAVLSSDVFEHKEVVVVAAQSQRYLR